MIKKQKKKRHNFKMACQLFIGLAQHIVLYLGNCHLLTYVLPTLLFRAKKLKGKIVISNPGYQTQNEDTVVSQKGLKSFASLFPAPAKVTFLV